MVAKAQLHRGAVRSCGCLAREQSVRLGAVYGPQNGRSKRKHWGKGTAEYRAWKAMRHRVGGNHSQVKDYAGRGIVIDPRWDDFRLFLEDMGPRPSNCHSLDRIDNDGDYKPENCRWALPDTQRRNSRRIRLVEFQGREQCLQDWSDEVGMSRSTLANRLSSGWSVERALTEPVRTR